MTSTSLMNKEDFLQASRNQLDLWGRHFEKLEDRVTTELGDARQKLRKRLDELRRRRRELGHRLDRAAEDGSDGWNKVREELDDAMQEFRTAASRVYDSIKN